MSAYADSSYEMADSSREKGSKYGGPKLRWQNYSEQTHLRARILCVFLALFVAFVLALLCVFAGKKPGYIESANLFTVNTSTLGHIDLKSNLPSLPKVPSLTDKRSFFDPVESAVGSAETAVSNAVPTSVHSAAGAAASKAHSAGGAIVSQVHSAEGALPTAVNSAESAAQNALNGAVDGLAKKLGIHQFYSVHVMNWCEGYYTPGYIANATNIPAKNVTKCSDAKRNHTFDLTDTVGHELIPGISLSDLHWPDAISTGFRALKTAINVMFVLYVIGIVWLGLGLLGVFLACIRDHKPIQALWNMIIAWVSHSITPGSHIMILYINARLSLASSRLCLHRPLRLVWRPRLRISSTNTVITLVFPREEATSFKA